MQSTAPALTVLTLKYGSQAGQEADLYLPSRTRCPVVCLLHGGFWRMPYGRDEMAAIAKDIASLGCAVWNIEYRRVGAPEGGWPGTFNDVSSAIGYLATLAADGVNLDLDRIIVAGHSAGGHLALWVAARNIPVSALSQPRVHPVAAVGLAPISDLAAAYQLDAGKGAVRKFIGGSPSEYPERYAAASPIALLPLGVKVLILHGAKDDQVPIELSRNYVTAAKKSGDVVKFVALADTGHMEFLEPTSGAHRIFAAWLGSALQLHNRE